VCVRVFSVKMDTNLVIYGLADVYLERINSLAVETFEYNILL